MLRNVFRMTLLMASFQIVPTSPALAQFFPPVGPVPNRPIGCAPGQFCANAAPFGFRCQTPQFWCGLPQPGPVGTPCYCNSPYGPIAGAVQQ